MLWLQISPRQQSMKYSPWAQNGTLVVGYWMQEDLTVRAVTPFVVIVVTSSVVGFIEFSWSILDNNQRALFISLRVIIKSYWKIVRPSTDLEKEKCCKCFVIWSNHAYQIICMHNLSSNIPITTLHTKMHNIHLAICKLHWKLIVWCAAEHYFFVISNIMNWYFITFGIFLST